ncbi:MAG: hypothetical protein ACLGIA_09900 [Actinomycetes bacterium]
MADSYYTLRDVERVLGEDDRTAELGVTLTERAGRLFIRGEVTSVESRRAVLDIVQQMCPGCEVVDEMSTAEATLSTGPDHSEEIR